MTPRKQNFLSFTLLLTVAAAIFRLFRLDAPLEYDEIWTLEYYATNSIRAIFTELALPNNHPLNSLAVRYTVNLGSAPQWIRLIPYLAGVLSVPLMGIVAFKFWRRKSAALWSMFFLAVLPFAVFHSQQARGYSLQLFFLLLFTVALFLTRRCPVLGAIGIVLGATGAMLTLPTSAFYLAAIGGVAAWRCRKTWKVNRPGMISLAIAGGISLFWVLINFNALQANRGWGIPLDSFSVTFEFLKELAWQNALPLLFAIPALLFCFRRSTPILWIWLCLAAAAIAFNAGQVRTYLPLAAATILLSGMGAAWLTRHFSRRRNVVIWLSVLVSLAGLSAAYQKPYPNWYSIHQMIQELPQEILVIAPANDSYPLAWNSAPDSYQEQLRRIVLFPPEAPPRKLLVISRNGQLSGCTLNGAESPVPVTIPGVPIPFETMQGMLYGLEELNSSPQADELVIAIVRPLPEAETRALLFKLLFTQKDFLTFNIRFSVPITKDDITYRYYIAGGYVTHPENTDWIGFLQKKPGSTTLYRVVPLEKIR